MLDTPAVGLTGSTTAACTSLQAPPCPLRLHSQHHTRRCSLLLRGVLITPSFVMAAYNVYSFTHFHTLPRTEIPWPRRMPPSRPPPCQPLSWHGGEPGARLPALSCLGNRCDSLRRAQHPTHTASVTPIRRSNAPGKGTRRRTRAPAQLHKREPRSTRSLPSQPPSTQPRTFEVEPCERPVLLERDRQSSRAVVADLIVCGVHSTQPTHGKRHTPTRRSHAPGNGTRRRTRAPAQLHKRGSRQLHKRVSLCIVRPRAAAGRGPTPNPPSHRAQSCVHPRRSVTSVVFFSSKVARALAPTSPRRFPAACAAPNPNGKRHNSKGPRNRGKRTRRTAERARAHISMVPHVRLPSGPAQPGHPAVSDL